MQARVRLFAIARSAAGRSELTVDLPEAATVADLRTALSRDVPELIPLMAVLRFAVDLEYADDRTPIPPGAELAVIPPVSGGEV